MKVLINRCELVKQTFFGSILDDEDVRIFNRPGRIIAGEKSSAKTTFRRIFLNIVMVDEKAVEKLALPRFCLIFFSLLNLTMSFYQFHRIRISNSQAHFQHSPRFHLEKKNLNNEISLHLL